MLQSPLPPSQASRWRHCRTLRLYHTLPTGPKNRPEHLTRRRSAHAGPPLKAARLFSFDSLNSLQNLSGTHHVRYHPLASLNPRLRPPCRHRKCPPTTTSDDAGTFLSSPQINPKSTHCGLRENEPRRRREKTEKSRLQRAHYQACNEEKVPCIRTAVAAENAVHRSSQLTIHSARRPPSSAPGAGTRRSRAPSSVSTWEPPTRVSPSSRLAPPRSLRTLRVPVPPPPSSPSPRVSFPQAAGRFSTFPVAMGPKHRNRRKTSANSTTTSTHISAALQFLV